MPRWHSSSGGAWGTLTTWRGRFNIPGQGYEVSPQPTIDDGSLAQVVEIPIKRKPWRAQRDGPPYWRWDAEGKSLC